MINFHLQNEFGDVIKPRVNQRKENKGKEKERKKERERKKEKKKERKTKTKEKTHAPLVPVKVTMNRTVKTT